MSKDQQTTPTPEKAQRVDELLLAYIDRLNAGEWIHREVVEAEHPQLAAEIMVEFETFLRLGDGDGDGDTQPLGTIGDYELRRQVGRGGMGVVYEAWQKSMHRRVALKMLPAGIAADARNVVRFVREAQVAGQLNHANIVSVYGMGVEGGTPFYAMEFVDGRTLAQTLAAGGPITSPRVPRESQAVEADRVDTVSARECYEIAEAFADVASGLQHAHQQGVIHRDIKPSNLMIDADGRLRILDFGLARLEGQESLTLSGDILGTPLYMSPEQAQTRKQRIDHRADIYSLGTTLYEALTREPPFRGKDHRDTLSRVLQEEPRPPRSLNAAIPVDLDTIVMKCLRKEPRDRYATAEAMSQDLQRFLRGSPIEARPQTRWEKGAAFYQRHRTSVTMAVGVLSLLFIGLLTSVVLIWREQRRTQAALQRVEESERSRADSLRHTQELLARSRLDVGTQMLDDRNPLGLLHVLEARRIAPQENPLRSVADWILSGWHQIFPNQLVDVLGTYGTGHVRAIAFSPDGRTLAIGCGRPNEAQIWNLSRGVLSELPLAHRARVTALEFSPTDGGIVATATDRGEVRLWSSTTGSLREMSHGTSVIFHLAFSPDGRLLASSSQREGTIKLWNCDDGVLDGPPIRHVRASEVRFSADGRLLAAGSNDGPAGVWRVDDREPHGSRVGKGNGMHRTAFSRDGRWLAVSSPGSAQLWRQDDMSPHGSPLPYDGDCVALSFDATSTYLATALADGTVQLWNAANATRHGAPLQHQSSVECMSFAPRGHLFATSLLDGTVHVWNAATARRHGLVLAHPSLVYKIAFHPDGRRLATASKAGYARLYDVSRAPKATHIPLSGEVHALAFRPRDSSLVIAHSKRSVDVWDLKTRSRERVLETIGPDIRTMAFRADGELLAVASKDGVVDLWSSNTWTRSASPLKIDTEITVVSFQPRTGALAVATREGTVRWIEPPYTEFADDLMAKPNGEVLAMAFSPEGELLATGGAGANTFVDMNSRRQRRPFAHGRTHALAFSPDGHYFASGNMSGAIEIWDRRVRRRIGAETRHASAIVDVRFSSDSRLLAAVSADGIARLWNLKTEPPFYSLPLLHSSRGRTLAFSSDGAQLAVGTTQSGVLLWPVPTIADSRSNELQTEATLAIQNEPKKSSRTRALAPFPWKYVREEASRSSRESTATSRPPSPEGGRVVGSQRLVAEIIATTKPLPTDSNAIAQSRYGELCDTLRRESENDEAALLCYSEWLLSSWALAHSECRPPASVSFDAALACIDTLEPSPSTRRQLAARLNDIAWSSLAETQPQTECLTLALRVAQVAVRFAPKRAEYWNTLGVAHFRTGEWAAAYEALKKTTRLRPPNAFDDFYLAMTFWHLGERQEALKHFDAALVELERTSRYDRALESVREEAAALLRIVTDA